MTDEQYHGVDNLEVLEDAVRYNTFLTDSVISASEGCRTAVDFGAGTGSISKMVRDRGLDVACVELDPALQSRLREGGFHVYDSVGAIPDASIEFFYTLNVLEHIEDDEGTVAALFEKLKPGGRLFIYVPALQMLFSSMDEKIGHYRRYHRADLKRIGTKIGFVVEHVAYADSMGVPATLAYKLVGSRKGDISPTSVRVYDRLVFPLSRALDRLGCSRLFGKNVVAVLRRPRNGESAG